MVQGQGTTKAGESTEREKLLSQEQKRRAKRNSQKEDMSLALLAGDFFLRSKDGKKLLKTKKFKKFFVEKVDTTGKRLKPRLALSASPISIQFKKDLFINFQTFSKGPIVEVTKKMEIQKRLPIHAVDKKDKTIVLKVYMGRRLEPIERDFKALLGILVKQAKELGIDLRRPRPRLEEYRNHLRVYDLRQDQIKEGDTSWEKIAKQIFPNEDIEGAKRKVRRYYDAAEEMVKGRWKDLL
jgi:hypothetical protein